MQAKEACQGERTLAAHLLQTYTRLLHRFGLNWVKTGGLDWWFGVGGKALFLFKIKKWKGLQWISFPWKKEQPDIHGNKILLILYHAQKMFYDTIYHQI